MTDKFSKEKRSDIMRKVKSSGNKSTEITFIKILKLNKIHGWRRNYKIKGSPDFVFQQEKLAIFLDGCFWHGHTCKLIPKSNQQYWINKINKNKVRDKFISKYLKSNGWHVIRIWECEIKKKSQILKINKFLSLRRITIG